MAGAGADVVELGIPFSDPLADGPTIQRASHHALRGGMSVAGTLALLRENHPGIPVVLFGYLNPILAYGPDRFVSDAHAAGASALLVTDLPVGSDARLEHTLSNGELDLIRLIAPTTPPERLERALEGASGFVYLISRLGVTGVRDGIAGDLADSVRRVRAATRLPIAVGFGISTPDQAAEVATVADGIVVGSALVRALEEGGVSQAVALLGTMRAALDDAAGPTRA
jgi:tryptophan synthase alpha chain